MLKDQRIKGASHSHTLPFELSSRGKKTEKAKNQKRERLPPPTLYPSLRPIISLPICLSRPPDLYG